MEDGDIRFYRRSGSGAGNRADARDAGGRGEAYNFYYDVDPGSTNIKGFCPHCSLALLTVAPSDHRLQLAIATIQADQGWSEAAAEKLRLLARLADLDDDAVARSAVAAFPSVPEVSAGRRPARRERKMRS